MCIDDVLLPISLVGDRYKSDRYRSRGVVEKRISFASIEGVAPPKFSVKVSGPGSITTTRALFSYQYCTTKLLAIGLLRPGYDILYCTIQIAIHRPSPHLLLTQLGQTTRTNKLRATFHQMHLINKLSGASYTSLSKGHASLQHTILQSRDASDAVETSDVVCLLPPPPPPPQARKSKEICTASPAAVTLRDPPRPSLAPLAPSCVSHSSSTSPCPYCHPTIPTRYRL